LWVGDFEEGPYVLVDGEVLPTYLCLFIDCHSRYVVEGRYYLSSPDARTQIECKKERLQG
jgi:hypothetical protein